ncbi:MAG: hypothetical protein U0P45_02090 [Acidimicrobiales bacterium]
MAPGDAARQGLYEKPFTKYERIRQLRPTGPWGFGSLAKAISQWSCRKLWVAYCIEKQLRRLGHLMPEPGVRRAPPEPRRRRLLLRRRTNGLRSSRSTASASG